MCIRDSPPFDPARVEWFFLTADAAPAKGQAHGAYAGPNTAALSAVAGETDSKRLKTPSRHMSMDWCHVSVHADIPAGRPFMESTNPYLSQEVHEREEIGQGVESEESEDRGSKRGRSPDVSSPEEEWYKPMNIEITVRSLSGDIVAGTVYRIDDKMYVDPSLGSIHHLAQAYRRRTEQGGYVDGEAVYAYIKCPIDDSGVERTIRCDELPNDKVRFYVSDKNLVSADGGQRGGPWYRIEVTASREMRCATPGCKRHRQYEDGCAWDRCCKACFVGAASGIAARDISHDDECNRLRI